MRQRLESGEVLFVPAGCAHGVATLRPNTVLAWMSDRRFDAGSADGVAWSHPALGVDWGVDWGVDPSRGLVSARDAALPLLADQPYRFDPSGRAAAG